MLGMEQSLVTCFSQTMKDSPLEATSRETTLALGLGFP
jgi:hypothetical protein